MPQPADRILLRDLLEHATPPEFDRRTRFVSAMPGVAAVWLWDNRAVLHRGCRYDMSHAARGGA